MKKRAVFAVCMMAGLMLVGSACGGSSSGSSSDPTSTTSKSSGGDDNGCAELFNRTEELSASMDALGLDATGDMADDMSAVVKALEGFTPSVPSAIRDDWKTIVAGISDYAKAIDGIDMTKMTDPATVEKLTKAGAVLESSKYQAASENIDRWTQKNCPTYANK